MTRLQIAQDSAADGLLSRDPFALLAGMMLDQQFPMERAFAGPYLLAERMHAAGAGREGSGNAAGGSAGAEGVLTLDPAALTAAAPEDVTAWMTGPPAVHRFPGSMGERLRSLAAVVLDQYGGDTTRIWTDPVPDGSPPTGLVVRKRLEALPGFGKQKASIFLALLGKQLRVDLPGWREAAGGYGEEGTYRSVADVRDAGSLAKVREFKKMAKAARSAG
ncbi:MAG TPA: HhH-GPD-type base excision DNA repair protein [Actinomycetales bacterium]|nr:HhH-GPD-type base excision DNA repair protein [Actinomycetales bacterium]